MKNYKNNIFKMTNILFMPDESQEAKDKFDELQRIYQKEKEKLYNHKA